mmetsp:Transcript_25757/g.29897  ORF Transcript_25757/g.29897 Transcript_25757/m.29897 type:complete len:117 (+) Transcript_25757:436-786(+)
MTKNDNVNETVTATIVLEMDAVIIQDSHWARGRTPSIDNVSFIRVSFSSTIALINLDTGYRKAMAMVRPKRYPIVVKNGFCLYAGVGIGSVKTSHAVVLGKEHCSSCDNPLPNKLL